MAGSWVSRRIPLLKRLKAVVLALNWHAGLNRYIIYGGNNNFDKQYPKFPS